VRLGISGLLGDDPARLETKQVEALAEAGFAGAGAFFAQEPDAFTPAVCRHVADAFRSTGVELVQLGAWPWPVIAADAAVRERSRRARREMLRVAGEMGARSLVCGPGTLHPRGGAGFDQLDTVWLAARENWDGRAFELAVDELRGDAEAAERHGVHLALECHVYTLLRDAASARALLDAVDSPWIRITFDPGNWVTLASYFETAPLIEDALALLGGGVLDGHAKDVRLADTTEVHFRDAVAGDGAIDFTAYLRGLARTRPDAYVIVEHTPPEDVDRAREHLLACARTAHIEFE
jgi:sugar phosphate isomerase/epimerase